MNKNLLYAALFIGLGIYYAYDTYYPEFVQWEANIAKLQQDIAQARQTAPKLAELSQEEAALKQSLRKSLDKLPSGAELADLMVMVLPIFEKAGIASNRIVSKNIGAATEKIIYRVHPIQIGGIKDVSIATIVQLLFELRSFHRIVNVESFTMARTGPNEYDISFNLETYSYIEAEGEDLGIAEEDTGAVPIEISVPVTEAAASEGAETGAASPESDSPAAAPSSSGVGGETPRAADTAAGAAPAASPSASPAPGASLPPGASAPPGMRPPGAGGGQ
jgi:Tfp pilus assembly protein PilO